MKTLKIFLIIFSFLLFVYSAYLYYLNLEPNFNIPAAKKNNSKVEYIENIPVVYIKGEGYSAGFAHGTLLKPKINEVAEILKESVFKNKIDELINYPFFLHRVKEIDKHIPYVYREEMKGIADGAGVSYNDILLINSYDDLLYLTGCSSIAALKSEKTLDLIHARNLDYSISGLADKNIIFHYLDKKFVSIGFSGYIGAVSATNYAGLTLSSHTSIVSEKDIGAWSLHFLAPYVIVSENQKLTFRYNKIGIPTGILYRMIMENAQTIEGAGNILSTNKRTIGNNLLISSLFENDAVVFELTADEMTIRKQENNYIISTNHFLNKNLAEKQGYSYNSSHKRYDFLENFFNQTENITYENIQNTMSVFDNKENWSSTANTGTIQSVIFIPAKGIIFVAKGKTPPVTQDGYVKYEYEKFVVQ